MRQVACPPLDALMIRTQPARFFDRIVAWSLQLQLPGAVRYLIATALVVAIGWGRVLFVPDTLPWLLFIPATIGIALVMGKGPGLFAAVLSTATGIVSLGTLLHPTWMPRQHWVAASLFLIVMLGLVMLTAELRESLRRARRLNEELVESERQAVDRQAFLSSVLASSTDCIKVLDLNGKLTFMSEGGQRVMEISDFNEVAGCPCPPSSTAATTRRSFFHRLMRENSRWKVSQSLRATPFPPQAGSPSQRRGWRDRCGSPGSR